MPSATFRSSRGPHSVNRSRRDAGRLHQGLRKGRVYYNALGHQKNVIDHALRQSSCEGSPLGGPQMT